MMHEVFTRGLTLIEKSYDSRRGKLLDIGCGHGFFLQMAKNRDWEVYGIDLCEPAVAYAISNGLDVSSTPLFEKNYRDAEFDAITMFYVLEHLPDPIQYLKEACRILKPGGLILLRTPHTTPIIKMLKTLSIPNRLYDAPSHLNDFSPCTIKRILQKTGFTDIYTCIGGKTYPHPLHQRIISYISGGLGEFLHMITFKKYLLPGVSKTTVARKVGEISLETC